MPDAEHGFDHDLFIAELGRVAFAVPVVSHWLGHSHPKGALFNYITPFVAKSAEEAAAIAFIKDLLCFSTKTQPFVQKYYGDDFIRQAEGVLAPKEAAHMTVINARRSPP